LVARLLAVVRRVEAEAVVEEPELRTDLVRGRELRLEVRVRAGEAVAVAAVGRRLELERLAVRVRRRVLTDLRPCSAQLARHELAHRRERVREDEAGREARVEERVRARRNRRRPVVTTGRREVQVVLVVELQLPERADQATL